MRTERSPSLWPGSRPFTAVCTSRLSRARSPWEQERGSRRSCDLSCRLLPTWTVAPPCPGLPGQRVSQQRTVPGTWLHPTCPAAPFSPQADWNLLGATLTDCFTQALGSACSALELIHMQGWRMSKRGSPMDYWQGAIPESTRYTEKRRQAWTARSEAETLLPHRSLHSQSFGLSSSHVWM